MDCLYYLCSESKGVDNLIPTFPLFLHIMLKSGFFMTQAHNKPSIFIDEDECSLGKELCSNGGVCIN